MPMSYETMGERLQDALEGAIFCEREEGAPDVGAAVVTVTFAKHNGGMRLFTLLETIMSGG